MEKKIIIETEQASPIAAQPQQKADAPAIPSQLQRPEFRFVLIPRGSKAPCEKHWPTTHNYRFDDPKLIRWLERGGNYGVCCGFGDLVGIDADDPVIAGVFEEHFGRTFRVRSGSGRGFHDYAIVHGLKKKQLFERNGAHLGEAQSLGQQLVGPGSIHPTGGVYTIVRDVPLVELDSSSFLNAFARFLKPELVTVQERHFPSPRTRIPGELQSIPLASVISIRGVRRGTEIHGSNPWHGSSTGRDFSANFAENIWHCFRCNAGGGVAKAIALNEGIITRCDQSLDASAFRRVLQTARLSSAHTQNLKGGEQEMEEQLDQDETATMCPTKAGNGFKLVLDGRWFYASKRQVLEMIAGRQRACTFRTIKDAPLV